MVAYGGLELPKLFTVSDEHAVIQQNGNLGLTALYVAFFGGPIGEATDVEESAARPS